MIENEYLCDYDINVPVFSSDPTLKNVCKYLIHNHESIIVYCSSRKEGKNVCNLLNEIQANSAKKNVNIYWLKYWQELIL